MIEWLDEDWLVEIHAAALDEGGGSDGFLNESHLSAALNRPRQLHHYEGATMFECAAAYVFGIAKAHAYNDGNKRTAWLAALVFLGANGIEISSTPYSEAASAVEDLATGAMSQQQFADWLSLLA